MKCYTVVRKVPKKKYEIISIFLKRSNSFDSNAGNTIINCIRLDPSNHNEIIFRSLSTTFDNF